MSDPFPGPAPPPGGPSAGAPPPPPRSTPLGATPTFGAAPPGGAPGYGASVAQPHWAQPAQRRGTNGLAVAAFVLGLLWLCTIGSILGIVFGFVALSQIKRTQQGGRGLAIAGIVLGFVGIAATVVIGILVATKTDELLHDPAEARDVTLESCTVGADGRGQAALSVTNQSSRTSGYVIRVRFTDDDDDLNVSGVDLVASGETKTVEVRSDQPVPEGRLDCAVTLVNRFASEGSDE